MHHDSITPGIDRYIARGETLHYSSVVRHSLHITCGKASNESGGSLTCNGDTFGQALRRLEQYCGDPDTMGTHGTLTPGIDRHLRANPTDFVELVTNERGRWTIRICVVGGLTHGWVTAGTLGQAIATMEATVARRYVAVVAA